MCCNIYHLTLSLSHTRTHTNTNTYTHTHTHTHSLSLSLSLSPQPVGHYTLAGIYLSLKDYTAASLHLRTALHMQPTFEHALSALRLVRCFLKLNEEYEQLKRKVDTYYSITINGLRHFQHFLQCLCNYLNKNTLHTLTLVPQNLQFLVHTYFLLYWSLSKYGSTSI